MKTFIYGQVFALLHLGVLLSRRFFSKRILIMFSRHSGQIPQVEASSDEDLEALQFTQTQTDHQQQAATETKTSHSLKRAHEQPLSMGRSRAVPPPLLSSDDYIVDFDGPDDPDHPYNWKFSVKYAGFSLPRFKMLIHFCSFQTISFHNCLLWNLCFFLHECSFCSRN